MCLEIFQTLLGYTGALLRPKFGFNLWSLDLTEVRWCLFSFEKYLSEVRTALQALKFGSSRLLLCNLAQILLLCLDFLPGTNLLRQATYHSKRNFAIFHFRWEGARASPRTLPNQSEGPLWVRTKKMKVGCASVSGVFQLWLRRKFEAHSCLRVCLFGVTATYAVQLDYSHYSHLKQWS